MRVELNGKKIKIENFQDYIDLYITDEGKPKIVEKVKHDRWEIACTISDGHFEQVSFVNSICTSKGGTHLNYIADQIVKSIKEKVEKRLNSGKKSGKAVTVKPQQIKNHMFLFVNCLIENPTFDS